MSVLSLQGLKAKRESANKDDSVERRSSIQMRVLNLPLLDELKRITQNDKKYSTLNRVVVKPSGSPRNSHKISQIDENSEM